MTYIAVIDYDAGNICSVLNALSEVRDRFALDFSFSATHHPDDIARADAIILPGVGSFKGCMDGIVSHHGLKEALDKAVLEDKKHFLGICVGMQLLAHTGLEHGHHKGLGYLPATIRPFTLEPHYKIPHMGWNRIKTVQDHVLCKDMDLQYLYFVHSYYMDIAPEYHILSCHYGIDFPAMIAKDNIIGMQFHPEKSHNLGVSLLRRFVEWID